MSYNRTFVEYNDDYPRTGKRSSQGSIKDLPPLDLRDVRRNERTAMRRSPSIAEQSLSRKESSREYADVEDRVLRRERSSDDETSSKDSRRSSDARSVRFVDPMPYDSGPTDDRRRRPRRRSRQQSESNDNGRLWYSLKDRADANFFEKNFDSSYEGLIATAAGGAIGAMVARNCGPGGDKKQRLKSISGAAVGAVAFNAAENWFRVYTEDRGSKRSKGVK